MPSADVLDVYRNDRLVGRLFDEQPLRFRYDADWIAAPDAWPLADSLPLDVHDQRGEHVHAYFENLLPEGNLRRVLSLTRHATTVFGLLRSVGGDTAGGLTLMPEGEKPLPPSYKRTTWERIHASLGDRPVPAFIAEAEGARVSLPGAQDKLLLMVQADGAPAIPQGTAPSSHILKPDIRGLEGVWASALNETFVMRLADELGLGVAEASFQPATRACLIRRYDRHDDGSGRLMRLHQLDFCQLAGKPSDIKYENDGGPSLATCWQLLRHSSMEAVDRRRLLQWIFFNLYVGNNDSHAKNLSMLMQADGAVRLAPFYDLMCTAMYPGLSRQFAFAVGGAMTPGDIDSSRIAAMAGEFRITPRYAMRVAHELGARLPEAVERVGNELRVEARPGTERTMLERIAQWILRNARKLVKRWQD